MPQSCTVYFLWFNKGRTYRVQRDRVTGLLLSQWYNIFFSLFFTSEMKETQLHNEMIIWPGFFKKFLFFLIHIYGDVQYFPTTSSRCGVAVPASKSAAEQTGEDVTGPGNNAVLITVSAKKPANSSEASPDQSTSSCWLCYSCTHSKHRTGFVLLFLVLQH